MFQTPFKRLVEINAGFLNAAAEEQTDAANADEGLEDAARDEQDYLRCRLRDELGREPTEEELNEWLRRHTEGY
ncbi:MAG: hypothetical protein ACR2GW_14985 [Pyrinomonadaceae bacterium]|jgi:hypothetical protein|nr:hypothetical protein [Pyrinomonadaceae bacterium]MDQ3585604.1 hypothetical protein [Acidobacteriota bacterium]